MRSSVWNRFPARTTSFTSSATCPSRIMRPYAAVNEKFSSTEICSRRDRKSTRLNSSHTVISYAVFCLKKKKTRDRQNSRLYSAHPFQTDERLSSPANYQKWRRFQVRGSKRHPQKYENPFALSRIPPR